MAELNISAFNALGRSIINGLNIDANGDDKIQASEFQNLFDAVNGNVQVLFQETNKLNGKSDVCRMDDDDVQAAIQNFNNLSEDDKIAVLDNATEILNNKINQLDKRYAELKNKKHESVGELLNSAYKSVVELGSMDAADVSQDTIVKYLDKYNEASKLAHKSIEKTTDALIEFGGKALFDSKIFMDAEDDITIGNKFEQTLSSYDKRINALATEILISTGDTKKEKITQFYTLMGDVSNAAIKYEKDSITMIYGLAYKTQQAAFSFQDKKENFLNNMPKETSFANRIVEYAVADALLSAPEAEVETTDINETKKEEETGKNKYLKNRKVHIVRDGVEYKTNGQQW